MNGNQIINMMIRMIVRQVMRRGINKGMDMATKGLSRDTPKAPDQRET